jgi:hypothetical protein
MSTIELIDAGDTAVRISEPA